MTILTNGMCTNYNLSLKMRRMEFSWILRYDRTRRPDQVLINKKKKLSSGGFDVPVDHKVNIKENGKIDKTWILSRKKTWILEQKNLDLGAEKNCKTVIRRGYQFWLAYLERSLKIRKRDWRNWRPSRLHRC